MEETFGQKLQRWRESANITQAELARRIEASATWISNLERDFSPTAKGGRPQPSVETCDKIARALGIKIAEVRLAAGYAAPSDGLISESDDRPTEAARAAEVIEGFLSLPRERQDQLLAMLRVLKADHPELIEMMKPPVKIVKAEDLTESDVEEIEDDTG